MQDRVRLCTLACGAALARRGERVAAGRGLTGPTGAGDKAVETGAGTAGLTGVLEVLAAQVGLPQILTAWRERSGRGAQKQVGRGREAKVTGGGLFLPAGDCYFGFGDHTWWGLGTIHSTRD